MISAISRFTSLSCRIKRSTSSAALLIAEYVIPNLDPISTLVKWLYLLARHIAIFLAQTSVKKFLIAGFQKLPLFLRKSIVACLSKKNRIHINSAGTILPACVYAVEYRLQFLERILPVIFLISSAIFAIFLLLSCSCVR